MDNFKGATTLSTNGEGPSTTTNDSHKYGSGAPNLSAPLYSDQDSTNTRLLLLRRRCNAIKSYLDSSSPSGLGSNAHIDSSSAHWHIPPLRRAHRRRSRIRDLHKPNQSPSLLSSSTINNQAQHIKKSVPNSLILPNLSTKINKPLFSSANANNQHSKIARRRRPRRPSLLLLPAPDDSRYPRISTPELNSHNHLLESCSTETGPELESDSGSILLSSRALPQNSHHDSSSNPAAEETPVVAASASVPHLPPTKCCRRWLPRSVIHRRRNLALDLFTPDSDTNKEQNLSMIVSQPLAVVSPAVMRAQSRSKILNHLWISEHAYIHQLRAVIEFTGPAQIGLPLSLVPLLELHEQLLSELTTIMRPLLDLVDNDCCASIINGTVNRCSQLDKPWTSSDSLESRAWYTCDEGCRFLNPAPDTENSNQDSKPQQDVENSKGELASAGKPEDLEITTKTLKVFERYLDRVTATYEAYAGAAAAAEAAARGHKPFNKAARMTWQLLSVSWKEVERGFEAVSEWLKSMNALSQGNGIQDMWKNKMGLKSRLDLNSPPINTRISTYSSIIESLCEKTPPCDDTVAFTIATGLLGRFRLAIRRIDRACGRDDSGNDRLLEAPPCQELDPMAKKDREHKTQQSQRYQNLVIPRPGPFFAHEKGPILLSGQITVRAITQQSLPGSEMSSATGFVAAAFAYPGELVLARPTGICGGTSLSDTIFAAISAGQLMRQDQEQEVKPFAVLANIPLATCQLESFDPAPGSNCCSSSQSTKNANKDSNSSPEVIKSCACSWILTFPARMSGGMSSKSPGVESEYGSHTLKLVMSPSPECGNESNGIDSPHMQARAWIACLRARIAAETGREINPERNSEVLNAVIPEESTDSSDAAGEIGSEQDRESSTPEEVELSTGTVEPQTDGVVEDAEIVAQIKGRRARVRIINGRAIVRKKIQQLRTMRIHGVRNKSQYQSAGTILETSSGNPQQRRHSTTNLLQRAANVSLKTMATSRMVVSLRFPWSLLENSSSCGSGAVSPTSLAAASVSGVQETIGQVLKHHGFHHNISGLGVIRGRFKIGIPAHARPKLLMGSKSSREACQPLGSDEEDSGDNQSDQKVVTCEKEQLDESEMQNEGHRLGVNSKPEGGKVLQFHLENANRVEKLNMGDNWHEKVPDKHDKRAEEGEMHMTGKFDHDCQEHDNREVKYSSHNSDEEKESVGNTRVGADSCCSTTPAYSGSQHENDPIRSRIAEDTLKINLKEKGNPTENEEMAKSTSSGPIAVVKIPRIWIRRNRANKLATARSEVSINKTDIGIDSGRQNDRTGLQNSNNSRNKVANTMLRLIGSNGGEKGSSGVGTDGGATRSRSGRFLGVSKSMTEQPEEASQLLETKPPMKSSEKLSPKFFTKPATKPSTISLAKPAEKPLSKSSAKPSLKTSSKSLPKTSLKPLSKPLTKTSVRPFGISLQKSGVSRNSVDLSRNNDETAQGGSQTRRSIAVSTMTEPINTLNPSITPIKSADSASTTPITLVSKSSATSTTTGTTPTLATVAEKKGIAEAPPIDTPTVITRTTNSNYPSPKPGENDLDLGSRLLLSLLSRSAC